jgi:hypothetical protein
MTKQILETLMTVLSEDDAKALIDHRKTTIKKPLTVRAAQNLVRQLAQVDDPSVAVDMIIDRCWQGFKADWYFRAAPTGRMTSATRRLAALHNEQKRLN